jgi:hypothetical protein
LQSICLRRYQQGDAAGSGKGFYAKHENDPNFCLSAPVSARASCRNRKATICRTRATNRGGRSICRADGSIRLASADKRMIATVTLGQMTNLYKKLRFVAELHPFYLQFSEQLSTLCSELIEVTNGG